MEILTAKRGGPSRDWLNPSLGLVKSQRARSKVKHWFARQEREENIRLGRDLLDKEFHRLGLADVNLEQLASSMDYRTLDDLLVAIGCNDIPLTRIDNMLMETEQDEEGLMFGSRLKTEPGYQSHDTITVLGLKGLLTGMAKCCNPVPGDEIVGYITRGRGATIHRKDCPNILRLNERERLVRVSWGEPKRVYPVSVRIEAFDRDNLLLDVSKLVSNEDINMGKVRVGVSQNSKFNMAVFDLILEVKDVDQLTRVLTRLETLPNVISAQRLKPG